MTSGADGAKWAVANPRGPGRGRPPRRTLRLNRLLVRFQGRPVLSPHRPRRSAGGRETLLWLYAQARARAWGVLSLSWAPRVTWRPAQSPRGDRPFVPGAPVRARGGVSEAKNNDVHRKFQFPPLLSFIPPPPPEENLFDVGGWVGRLGVPPPPPFGGFLEQRPVVP